MLKIINLTKMFNTWCRGTIDIAMTLHVNGVGFRPPPNIFFFAFFCGHFAFVFLVSSSVFFTYFHFLTDLNNTGRLTASSLSAFIFKVILLIHELARGTF